MNSFERRDGVGGEVRPCFCFIKQSQEFTEGVKLRALGNEVICLSTEEIQDGLRVKLI